MRRAALFVRIALVGLLALIGGSAAWAATCTCNAGTTCIDTSSTNWSCAAIPDATSDVFVSATSTVNFAGATWTLNTLTVNAGGTFNCSGAGDQTLTIDNIATVQGLPTALFLEGGSSTSATFTCGTGSNGAKTIVSTATGVATTTQSIVWQAGGTSSNLPATDIQLTFRGAERMLGTVTQLLETTAYKTCFDSAAVSGTVASVAVGDTVVFTGGKSDTFWYPVACKPDDCTGVGAPDACCLLANTTANCGATDCNGGPCDIELSRNSTGTAYNSHLLAGSVGGPVLEPDPLDSNADGTADATGTLPAVGDSFVAFKPSQFKGNAGGFAGGVGVVWEGVQYNSRYVELSNLAGDSDACTADTGLSSIHYAIMKPISDSLGCSASGVPLPCCTGSQTGTCAAGTFGLDFQNVHDWVSRNSHEINRTDNTLDAKSNYGFTGDYWYLHDPGGAILTCNAGGVSAQSGLGAGIAVTTDNGANCAGGTCVANICVGGSEVGQTCDNYDIKTVNLRKIHIARVNSSPFSIAGPQHNAVHLWSGIRLDDFFVHDWPKQTTYPPSGQNAPALTFSHGTDFEANRWTVFNGGNVTVGATRALNARAIAVNTVPATFNSGRFDSWWVVNIDDNNDGAAPGESIMNLGVSGATNDTSRLIVSNSYFANFVNGAGTGGTWRFNFIRNPLIDDGNNACDATEQAVLMFPVEATGNVIYRDNAESCWSYGILDDFGDVNADCPYIASGTQYRYTSNVIANNGVNTSIGSSAISSKWNAGGTVITCGIDAYNNLLDMRDADSAAESVFRMDNRTTPDSTAVDNVFYNIFMNSQTGSQDGLTNSGDGVLNHGGNRFIRIGDATPVLNSGSGSLSPAGLASTELDSDLNDLFPASWSNDYRMRCETYWRTGNSWGGPIGPVAFGLKSFADFHPAALALVNADAYKMRYDFRSCSNAFEDTFPR